MLIGHGPKRDRARSHFEVPCGKCIGCCMDRAREWSVRIGHERMMWPDSQFVTLTYSPEEVPVDGSLRYSHFQRFMRDLRREEFGIAPGSDGSHPIRFFCAGEYGGRTGRPHFHAILFNVRFPDQRLLGLRRGEPQYASKRLENLWSRGHVDIGTVTPESAAYVAGYLFSKARRRWFVKWSARFKCYFDVRSGEVIEQVPEFVRMSLRPGIGAGWYEKYGSDLFPLDAAVAAGRKHKVPRYYFKKFRSSACGDALERVTSARELRAAARVGDGTTERRAVREEFYTRLWASRLERSL